MADKGVAMVFKGEKKNLRGRYNEGSCIKTPNGFFLWRDGSWWMAVEKINLDFKTGRCFVDNDFVSIKK